MSRRLVLTSWSLISLLSACTLDEPLDASRGPLVGSDLVIALVHPGGGNSGAAFDRDFVVVSNRGNAPRSLGGLSLQYASATGTASLGAAETTRTALPATTLAPGAAVLVAGAFGAGDGAPVPRIDVDDTTPAALATSGGRLALVSGVEPLGCNGGSTPCDSVTRARVLDLVAWGSATWAEGAPTPAPSNSQVLVRLGGGCVDGDSNSDDFERVASFARDSSDPARPCAGDAGVGPSDASVAIDAGTDAAVIPDASSGIAPSRVQGTGSLSPIEDTMIADLRGVVTYVESRRFAIEVDGAALDSNAVFVKTAGAPGVGVGSVVSVDGVVRESRPRCTSCPGGEAPVLSVTTVEASRIVVLGSGVLPTPFDLGTGFPDTVGPYEHADRDLAIVLDPAGDALDRLERLEARRVRFGSSVVVGPTRTMSDGRRMLAIASTTTASGDSSRPLAAPPDGKHGGAFVVVDSTSTVLPFLDVGDRFEGELVGVVDTDEGRPILRLVSFAGARRNETPEANRPFSSADSWSLATFNVHGIAVTDSSLRFASVAHALVDDLGAPDVVVLEEVSDDSGTRDDGTVTSAETLARLVDAIRIAGGPRYDAVSVDPIDGSDGGAPGANIRPVVFFRADRGFALPVREGIADAPRLGRRRGEPAFSPNPCRLGADQGAFVDSRKPLLVELVRDGESTIVVAVHLRSHLGDEPRLGRMQPPSRPNDARRLDQVIAVVDAIDGWTKVDPSRAILVAGDFNDGPGASAIAPLRERDFLPAAWDDDSDIGTYVYDGLATNFDRAHVSPSLASRVRSSRPVHLGASRSDGVSDHDPVLVEFGPPNENGRVASCALALRPSGSSTSVDFVLATFVVASLGFRRSRRCP